jgi:AbiV family abortive infection protein
MQNDERQITAEELRNAGVKSLQNASELVEEAQLLFDHGRWSRAVFLCCISGEELGKCFISLSAIINRRAGTFDERRYKERFRIHRQKTSILNFFEDTLVSSSTVPIQPSDIVATAQMVEKTKLASLYCDFYGVEARAPSELITEELATVTLRLAKKRVEHFSERVGPKFDHALEIEPSDIQRFRREFFPDLDF